MGNNESIVTPRGSTRQHRVASLPGGTSGTPGSRPAVDTRAEAVALPWGWFRQTRTRSALSSRPESLTNSPARDDLPFTELGAPVIPAAQPPQPQAEMPQQAAARPSTWCQPKQELRPRSQRWRRKRQGHSGESDGGAAWEIPRSSKRKCETAAALSLSAQQSMPGCASPGP